MKQSSDRRQVRTSGLRESCLGNLKKEESLNQGLSRQEPTVEEETKSSGEAGFIRTLEMMKKEDVRTRCFSKPACCENENWPE